MSIPRLNEYFINSFLTNRQRRSAKSAELAQRKAKKSTWRDGGEQASDGSGGADRPESEERMDFGNIDERHIRRKRMTNMEVHEETRTMGIQQSRFTLSSCATGDRQSGSKSIHHIYSLGPPSFGPSRVSRTRDQDPEMDQGTDTDSCTSTSTEIGQGRHQWPVMGTDLDSAAGR
jgi:hypothetical protein